MGMIRLEQVLSGNEENYILPFFWQHGEPESVLREYMNAIHDANIGAVCLEARPHPDFAGEKWWHDLDVILDEAKRLGMKIWILDDAHFPSGQAAGRMAEMPCELQKQYLDYHVSDICGPVRSFMLDVGAMAKYFKSPFDDIQYSGHQDGKKTELYTDDRLMAVIASRLDGKEGDPFHLCGSSVDLTKQVQDGILTWDVPEGYWRIFVIYTTRNGKGRSGYVNFMSKESCRVQIDAVYEPHYARYKEEFGRTIAGFFSDEPEIGNTAGYSPENTIGNPSMSLPWSEELEALMKERFGNDYMHRVPALWFSMGTEEFTADTRVGFMDLVTRLAQKNFGEQMGDWCSRHGVEYIGHVVEDMDVHARLGAGQGHYFRALRGQDWAGVDTIGSQIVLGGENVSHNGFMGIDSDGDFYHHRLARLGISLADTDPRKQGRVLCEAFGAYGWNEGTRLMKYITDHLLVRGINHFVPHAFSPGDFPDPDCPPHFYAHGKNPLYKPFGSLMRYINRISHLISGGMHQVEVAVLYDAEQEWSGCSYEGMGKTARQLDDAQIDFSFVPNDIFEEREYYRTAVDNEGLHVNGHTYKVFIIPGGDYIPGETRAFAKEAASCGIPVFYLNPDASEHNMICIDVNDLADELKRRGITDVTTDGSYPFLQTYHYEHADGAVYLISNESAWDTFDGRISLSSPGKIFGYDAMKNEIYGLEQDAEGVVLYLRPYEMAVLVIPKADNDGADCSVNPEAADVFVGVRPREEREIAKLSGFRVSFVQNEDYPNFTDEMSMELAENVLTYRPDFSGVIRYETEFFAEDVPVILELEDVYESAEVWCNGQYIGERICPPYRFSIGGAAKIGVNSLRIEVRTTLERKVHALTGGVNFVPFFEGILPEGIIGEVRLLLMRKE